MLYPLFSSASPPVSTEESAGEPVSVPFILFDWEEVESARKTMQSATTPGPDGLFVSELNQISISILAHIFNNWNIYKTFPEDLKLSRMVFVPKNSDVNSPDDLRQITRVSLFERLFSKLLFSQFSSATAFHPPQNGFKNNCATSNNLLILQGLMKHVKHTRIHSSAHRSI